MRLWLRRMVLAVIAVALVAFLAIYREPLSTLVNDPERIRAWLVSLGPLGPLGLIGINAAQVVVAPIPGYLMQIVAGYLFGWLPGAIYGSLGMALGAVVSMNLARIFGRPLVCRVVGVERLERWERVTRLNSLGIWFVIMLGPFGDIPYYIAGLTRLAIWKIMLIALLVRGPSVAVAAAIGAGVISWRSPWIIGGAILLLGVGLVAMRYQDHIERWVDEQLLSRVLAVGKEPVDRPSPNPTTAEAGTAGAGDDSHC